MNATRPALLVAALSAAAGALAAPAQPIVVQAVECRSDDASWRLDASRATAQFTAVAPKKREVVFRGMLQTLSPAALVWRGDSTHLPRETLVLTAREEACKPAAPDATPLTHRAVLSIRAGEAMSGCCVVRAGYDARVAPVANVAAKKADDWARAVQDLMPAITTCVARASPRFKAVAQASASGSTATIRLVEIGGNAVDCTVDTTGRSVPVMTAVATDSASPAGAGNPLYYPPREPPPLVSCGTLERVQTPRGALAGYLHYDPC